MVAIGALNWPALGPHNQATWYVKEIPNLRVRHNHRQPRLGWNLNSLPGDTSGSRPAQQAMMDQELRWAAAAGLKFIAHDWYVEPPGPATIPENALMHPYMAHKASPLAPSVKFSLIMVAREDLHTPPGPATAKDIPGLWDSNYKPWLLAQFALPNYMKVTIGSDVRPLLFFHDPGAWEAPAETSPYVRLQRGFGSASNALAKIGAPGGSPAAGSLRAASIAAGTGDPYIVSTNRAGNAWLDGNSAYGAFGPNTGYGFWNPSPGPHPTGRISWTEIRNGDLANWASGPVSGKTLVPGLIAVSDPEPRTVAEQSSLTDFDWAWFYGWRGDEPTYRQFEDHVQDLVDWITANPTLCPSGAALIGAWHEEEESGRGIVPNLPADGSGKGFHHLEAIRAVLTGNKPAVYVNSYNGDNLAMTTSGTWARSTGADPTYLPNHWNNDEQYTEANNAYKDLADARAIGFEWLTTKGPDRGIAEVLVDGVSRGNVDLYAAATTGPVLVWSTIGLTPGVSHTLRIRHTGTKNPLNVAGYTTLGYVGIDVIHAICRR